MEAARDPHDRLLIVSYDPRARPLLYILGLDACLFPVKDGVRRAGYFDADQEVIVVASAVELRHQRVLLETEVVLAVGGRGL